MYTTGTYQKLRCTYFNMPLYQGPPVLPRQRCGAEAAAAVVVASGGRSNTDGRQVGSPDLRRQEANGQAISVHIKPYYVIPCNTEVPL